MAAQPPLTSASAWVDYQLNNWIARPQGAMRWFQIQAPHEPERRAWVESRSDSRTVPLQDVQIVEPRHHATPKDDE